MTAKTTATHTVPDGTVYTRSTSKAPFLFAVEGFRTTGYYAEKDGAHWVAGFSTSRKAADRSAAEMIAYGDSQVRVIEL